MTFGATYSMSGLRASRPCIASEATMQIIEAKKHKKFERMQLPGNAKPLAVAAKILECLFERSALSWSIFLLSAMKTFLELSSLSDIG